MDYVFLNAGVSVRDLALESKLEVERRIMDINFWGPVAITKALLKKRDSNVPLHLVVTSSLSGKYGVPKLATYSASKHAIQGYFDSLRARDVWIWIGCPSSHSGICSDKYYRGGTAG
ncbi:SDR family NAD(P)-dependent oxidoreductase [Algoriphagus boritolerans]|uniref:SDR family NAD(P)-dependent oxidoreductase n=1 Tax=Algoriphagus boritolerans TaxID=308111 RepID=UPI000A5A600A